MLFHFRSEICYTIAVSQRRCIFSRPY